MNQSPPAIETESLTGGQAVVKSLIAHGVDTVFGLPGVQNDWLYNAFYDYKESIRVIHPRHEQGAGYMALGYHLASGRDAVYNIVPGPGFLNSSAALATAYGLNARVLCLVGQTPRSTQGKGWGVLHEIPDQIGIMRSLTKWAEIVKSPSEAPDLVAEAFLQLHEGRPRPVGLEVAMDVLKKEEDVDTNVTLRKPTHITLDEDAVNQAAKLLAGARRPLIFVSSGAIEASNEVVQLAEWLQAPVFSYRTGKGIVSSRHPLSFPVPAAYDLWKEADVVIGIGSRMRMPLLKWGRDEELKIISINVDANDHNCIAEPTISITNHARPTVLALLNALPKHGTPRKPDTEMLETLRTGWNEKVAYLEPQATYLRIIREEMPDDGIFVDELTQVGFASRILWESYQPRTYLSTGYMGTLGWGFPTALGAKVARPDVPVISVAGDGGLMFAIQELATAVQHKIGVTVLLFNNNLFGNVRSMQENLYDNRVIATDLHNPDFVKMAHSFGANAARVTSFDGLRSALREARGESLPTLIEIPVGNDWPSTNRFKSLPKIR
ncbi:MAG: hypothetical protein KTR29_01800 [Rhodothermaceae bacterium]|nr:hypothetical protein [Rhodothermaceae bacterium]